MPLTWFIVFVLVLGAVAAVDALGWTLIYVARFLEFVKISWNTAWMRSRFGRILERPVICGRVNCHAFTPSGRVVFGVFGWCYPTAVFLTKVANRLLPPLDDPKVFLTRLYERRHRTPPELYDARRNGTR